MRFFISLRPLHIFVAVFDCETAGDVPDASIDEQVDLLADLLRLIVAVTVEAPIRGHTGEPPEIILEIGIWKTGIQEFDLRMMRGGVWLGDEVF